MAYTNEQLLDLYQRMVLSRVYEETACRYLKKGALTYGAWHMAMGEEAAQAGCISAMQNGDFYAPTHRCHGAMAQLLDLNKFTAESICKVEGYQRGKSSAVHIGDLNSGVLNANGILGAGAPISVGFALGLKKQGKKGAVIFVTGDAASNEGNFYEAINLAGALEAPIVFFIENNGIGMTNEITNATKAVNLADKGKAVGIPGVTVDGMDVVAVREAMDKALEDARNFKPSIVEVKTCRYDAHSVGMPDVGRPADIVAEGKKRDPIVLFEEKLYREGILNDELKQHIYDDTEKRSVAAFEYAISCTDPDREMSMDLNTVYANVLDNLA